MVVYQRVIVRWMLKSRSTNSSPSRNPSGTQPALAGQSPFLSDEVSSVGGCSPPRSVEDIVKDVPEAGEKIRNFAMDCWDTTTMGLLVFLVPTIEMVDILLVYQR